MKSRENWPTGAAWAVVLLGAAGWLYAMLCTVRGLRELLF